MPAGMAENYYYSGITGNLLSETAKAKRQKRNCCRDRNRSRSRRRYFVISYKKPYLSVAETMNNNINDDVKNRRVIAFKKILAEVQEQGIEDLSAKHFFVQRLYEIGDMIRSNEGQTLLEEQSYEQLVEFCQETMSLQEGLFPELDVNIYYHEIIDTMGVSSIHDRQVTFNRDAQLDLPVSSQRNFTIDQFELNEESDFEENHLTSFDIRALSNLQLVGPPSPPYFGIRGRFPYDGNERFEQYLRESDRPGQSDDNDSVPELIQLDDRDDDDNDNDVAPLVDDHYNDNNSITDSVRPSFVQMSVNIGNREVLPYTHPLRLQNGADIPDLYDGEVLPMQRSTSLGPWQAAINCDPSSRTIHGHGLFLIALHNNCDDVSKTM